MNKILVLNEKHGTWYYDASTPEILARSSLRILTNRFNDNWYCNDNSPWYHDVEKVVAEQDTRMILIGRGRFEREVPIAWDLLQERVDYEYEEILLEEVL